MNINVPVSKTTPIKLLYTSDIHTNKNFLSEVLELAISNEVNAIIINGDIIPKSELVGVPITGMVKKQRDYILFTFLPSLIRFREDNPSIKIFLDFGNDDFKVNRYFLQQHDGNLFKLLHLAVHELTPEINIAGYMCVPITPFGIKDWEKADKKGQLPQGSTTYGFKSINKNEIIHTTINVNSEDTIENDLKYFFSKMPKKRFVFVCHTPPYRTALDMLADRREHVGSMAVREFIEKRNDKIVMSLHGHIHESPDISGRYLENIGDTTCINVGQTDTVLRYAVITLG